MILTVFKKLRIGKFFEILNIMKILYFQIKYIFNVI